MNVCCDYCVLSGRGLCDGLITHPEESYRLWCVVVCDLETSWMRRPWPTGGWRAKNNHYALLEIRYYYGLVMGTVFWLVTPCAAVHIYGPYKGTSSALKKVHQKIWYFSNRLQDVSHPPHDSIPCPLHTQIYSHSFVLVCALILFYISNVFLTPYPVMRCPT